MRDSRVKYETHFRFVHSVLATLFISGAAVHPNDLASWTLHGNTYSQPTEWMVAEAGYPVESHDVVTEDGYILTVHRLPAAHSTGSTVHTVQCWLVTCH